MGGVSKEREIVLEALRQERALISKDLGIARDETFEMIWREISRERAESFEEVEGIFARTVDLSFQRMDDLLVKIFMWVLGTLGLASVGCAALIVLYQRRSRG